MDAWANTDLSISGLTSNTLGGLTASNVSHVLNYSDPIFSQILTAKKALQISLEANIDSNSNLNSDGESKSIVELLIAACDGDLVTVESIIHSNSSLINNLYPTNLAGITCLIYAIVFDQYAIVECLLNKHNADPDQYDTLLMHYTPLMWAIHFKQLDMVKLLFEHQADPYLTPDNDSNTNNKNAISLVTPEKTEIYEFFKSHNLLNRSGSPHEEEDEPIYKSNDFHDLHDESIDNISNQIKLQSISAKTAMDSDDEEENFDEEQRLSDDHLLVLTPTFEYDKLITEQYIKFTDSDIPSLLNYIFDLRVNNTSLQHNTKVPAGIIFQMIRYSHLKVDSKELTEFFFECFILRLKSVTNTRDGYFNLALSTAEGIGSNASDKTISQSNAGGAADIVLLSYWLSVIQFLHFYLCKNDIYKVYPDFLQQLINIVQSLIATLSFSINSRLNKLINDCLLNFTSLVDVSNVLYAKDWNLFKNKNKKHPSTYDDIFNMLYPPTQSDLMKPSPIRYIQVLGALDYVLKVHEVDTLFKFQTFSQVFYYINATIFNKIINNSKYCSRSKAIQLRLNISTLEDWLRSHNYKIYKPDYIGGLINLLGPDNKNFSLHNLLEINNNSKDPHSLSFYYNSLYHVGKSQLTPTIELLQWLQCMSALNDGDSLINTINQFESLNYYQLYKIMHKSYKYEIDEPKLSKTLVQLVKKLINEQGENQITKNNLHYITQSNFLLKENYIYLDVNFVFNTALPNLSELINNYGSGIGGLKILRAKKYQPTLPISVLDDIDDIKNSNRDLNVNDTYDYEQDEQDNEDAQDDEPDQDEKSSVSVNNKNNNYSNGNNSVHFKGDELFKQVQVPSSLAHKPWGNEDIEVNPW